MKSRGKDSVTKSWRLTEKEEEKLMIKKQMQLIWKAKRQVISVVLVIALAITGLNWEVMSNSIYAGQKNKAENIETTKKFLKEVATVKELPDERTEKSNTYLMSDGTKKLEIYGENIRYKEKGKWKNYDSTLNNISGADAKKLKAVCKTRDGINPSAYEYVNTQGNCKQYFSKQLDREHPIVLSKEAYVICFSPLEEVNPKADRTGRNNADTEKNIKVIEENKVSYSASTQDIEYVYTSLNNGVKEEIILKRKPEKNTFAFRYDWEGVEAVEYNDYIFLADKKSGNIVASISAPYLSDVKGNISYDAVEMKLEKSRDGSYLINLTVEEDYLNDESRYPVTIDPTVYWNINNSGYINSYDTNPEQPLAVPGTYRFYTGIDSEGYEKISYILCSDMIKEIKGKHIDYAVFEPVINDIEGKPVLGIKNVQGDCGFMALYQGNIPRLSSKTYGTTNCAGNKFGDRIALDMTEIVSEIAAGSLVSYGIALKTENTGNGNTLSFCGTAEEKRPVFCIRYRETEDDAEAVYDGSFNISGKGRDENSILLEWEQNDDTDVYQVYARDTGGGFKSVGFACGTEYTYTWSSNAKKIDFRVIALKNDKGRDTANGNSDILSNIITFEKKTDTSASVGAEEVTKVTYEQVVADTDGDGLEDGYEIWDFKTKWNVQDTNRNFIVDSDGDGFSDSYEVFTLGTDPAVANTKDKDSDGDGLKDIDEFNRGTDPHLADSDFDGLNDLNDYDSTDPRKTDNPDINGTDRSVAYNSSVYVGLYEREYSEEKNGVTYSYIQNIYNGNIKQVRIDYGDSSLNKTIKYFYDADGNQTAVIEQYDSAYDPSHEQTICTTYTYNDNNIEFICDRETKYTMVYDDGKLKSFKIGNQEIVNYEDVVDIDRTEEIDKINFGNLITSETKEINYKNNQKTKICIYRYKVQDNDFSSAAFRVSIYYDSNVIPSYHIQYNIEGEIIKFIDYTQSTSNPIIYNYTSGNGNTTVTRSDGFTKSVTKKEETDTDNKTHTTTTTTNYTYKDLKATTATKSSTLVSKIDEDNNISSTVNMYEKDKYEYRVDPDNRVVTEKIYSTTKKKYLLNMSQIVHDNSSLTRFFVTGEIDENGVCMESSINYTYDLAGNITQIRQNNEKINEYSYDPHGRVIEETDYKNQKYYIYEYDTLGNVVKKTTYILNKVGELKEVANFEYNNNQWSEQLTSYEEKGIKYEITYDNAGNPVNFIDGKVLAWNRGRLLKGISYTDDSKVTYRYNENGYRTYKSTANSDNTDGVTTVYEWDENKLIRETNTNLATDKTYDIWYLYDDRDNIIGYDYVYIDANSNIKSNRVYYEKDIQGSVIALWNENGYRIATYSYDVWGNLINSTCSSIWSELCGVNHIGYKGYYTDNESGFYYSGKEYYVPKLGRMLNMDEPSKIIEQEKNIASAYLNYSSSIYSNTSSTLLPTDMTGYDIDYGVDEYVEYCDTSSLLFESMNMYNTNCYGFAINCWTYEVEKGLHSRILPGIFRGNVDYWVYATTSTIAEYVKQDMEYFGKEAIVLTGNDNNPYYETDDEHCLIAVRTMDEQSFKAHPEADYCHFMIRKDDGWYFKSGWQVGIFKLKGNHTPNTVTWTQYDYDANGKVKDRFGYAFYTSDIQYIVIPKMSLTII